MGAKTIYYTVCRYVPDILRDEFINIGVLTHIPEDEWCHFHKTKNLARIKHFDDEIDNDVISVLLESLEYQFNTNHFDFQGSEFIGHRHFLEEEISYFVNQIQFSEIRTLASDDIDSDITDLCDMYLYYDNKKSERISRERVKRLVSKMFTNSSLNSRVERQPQYKNSLNQQTFDFSVNLNDTQMFVKALSFDYKQQNKLFTEIKSFIYDINDFESNHMNTKDIKVVINNTQLDQEFQQKALQELKTYIDVFTLEEFAFYIHEAESRHKSLKIVK
ncbi:hypothetical protein ACVWY7_000583 [Bacillus sp. TE9106W]